MQAIKVKTCPHGDDYQAWVLVTDTFTRTWIKASEILGDAAEAGIFDRINEALDYGNKAMKAVGKKK